MAETTKFVVEGTVTLAFISSESDARHVFIENKEASGSILGGVLGSDRVRLESRIAEELDFPNEAEFDVIFRKITELQEKKLRPIEGEPDGTREVNLRITVEVLP